VNPDQPSEDKDGADAKRSGKCVKPAFEIETSLPRTNPVGANPTLADLQALDLNEQCRLFAELMCKAVARSTERWYHKADKNKDLPTGHLLWVLWALKADSIQKCRDLTLAFDDLEDIDAAAAESARLQKMLFNNTVSAVMGAGNQVASHKIDDWGQE